MSTLDRPRLRPYLEMIRDHQDPRYVLICDRLGLAKQPRRITWEEFLWVQLFDGQRSLREIQDTANGRAGGRITPFERFATLVRRMDESLLLDGPRYREYLANPVREPNCIGCYPADPAALRAQLTSYFTRPDGPGLPQTPKADGRLRAAFVPHIDYARGGTTYACGFKEVFENCPASLFVVIGTSHHSLNRFTLTRKNFKTPLGIVCTAQDYVDMLVSSFGDGLFEDECAHLPEHSIELEVVFLQYLYEGKRPIRIVPLVVGSFHDCVIANSPPSDSDDIQRMIVALRSLERKSREPICYVISGDLAHLGPKFGDADPVAKSTLDASRRQDHLLIQHMESVNANELFHTIASESDARRICGFPPAYIVLEAIRPVCGRLLHYGQFAHPRGWESVSFASLAFYGTFDQKYT